MAPSWLRRLGSLLTGKHWGLILEHPEVRWVNSKMCSPPWIPILGIWEGLGFPAGEQSCRCLPLSLSFLLPFPFLQGPEGEQPAQSCSGLSFPPSQGLGPSPRVGGGGGVRKEKQEAVRQGKRACEEWGRRGLEFQLKEARVTGVLESVA